MGSQGIPQVTDAGATWTVLGADVLLVWLTRSLRVSFHSITRLAKFAVDSE